MEGNNMKVMKEALEAIADSARTGSISQLPSATLVLRTCEIALAAPPRNCDVIPSKDLVDEFCKSLGYDVMNERNGYAAGQNRFMQEHWFEFSKWISMPYKQTKGDINGRK